MDQPHIPESVFEHKQTFANPWVDHWVLQNPFISPILEALRSDGVVLADFSFNRDPANIAEVALNVLVRRLNAAVRIGLDTITYTAFNADWGMAPQLAEVFEHVSEVVRKIIGARPDAQEATLGLHVVSTEVDFSANTALLVSSSLLAGANFCGISIYRDDGVLTVDKSVKYDHAAFIRLQHRFAGDASFAEVATLVYEREIGVLRLLGFKV